MCGSTRARGGTIAFLTIDNRAKLNTLDRALMTRIHRQRSRRWARARICARWCCRARATRPSSAAPAFRRWRRLTATRARDFITLVHRTCDCLAPAAGAGDRAHRRLCARRRAGSGGVLRSARGDDAGEIRHAGDESRHSLGGGGGAHSAVDRLRPRARAVDAGRDHRRRDRAALGPGRARGGAGGARRAKSRRSSRRCCPPVRRRCAVRRR